MKTISSTWRPQTICQKVQARTLDSKIRRDRGLSKPEHYFQALQFNMAGGAPPGPDSNGVSYFRLPLNALPRAAKPFTLKLIH